MEIILWGAEVQIQLEETGDKIMQKLSRDRSSNELSHNRELIYLLQEVGGGLRQRSQHGRRVGVKQGNFVRQIRAHFVARLRRRVLHPGSSPVQGAPVETEVVLDGRCLHLGQIFRFIENSAKANKAVDT